MFRNQQQNKQLHGLLGELGIEEKEKANLVSKYTNGRTDSSAKMLLAECQALINFLKVQKGQKKPSDTAYNSKSNAMRRKILSMCHEMRWTVGLVLDWDRIDNWMTKFSYLHKPLNDYTEAELPKLVTQFQKLLDHYYAA